MKHTFWLSLPLATFSCLISLSVKAQVTPDGTTSTTVNQNGNDFTIEQGDRIGNNLFHSFNEFSIPTGGSAGFNNAGDISNIFSRVTGSSISNIDGLLGANGAANLYLINPNGIIFGENARLNLGGSFFASTADSLLFEGDTEFSAVNPEAPPLLEVSIPVGARFRDNPGDIIVRGNGQGTRLNSELIDTNDALRVNSDKTFVLAGGNLIFEGATIKTAGGRIELGSVEGNEQIGLTSANEGFSLNFDEVQNFRDIQFSQAATIDASGEGAGAIHVQGKNIALTDNSTIEASTLSSAPETDIEIISSDSINLSNGSNILSLVYTDAEANAGTLSFNTPILTISDGSLISSTTFGSGNAGDISIQAEEIEISNTSDSSTGIFAFVNTEATGDGGQIDINTENLNIRDATSFISASTLSQGNSGTINITATDSINVSNNANIWAIVFESGVGNGGDLRINTSDFTISNGSSISTSTLGIGDGGNIFINASDSIAVDNSTIFNLVGSEATGNAGITNITTTNLSLTNGGEIDANALGNGNSGSVSIDATESVRFDGAVIDEDGNIASSQETGIFSQVNQSGDTGNIDITTANLTLIRDGRINNTILGTGNAGNISINASESVAIAVFSHIFNGINSDGEGMAGDIKITTNNLSLESGSFISSSTLGTGDGGDILIDARELFSIKSGSNIFNIVGIDAVGNAGNTTIDTEIFDLNGSAGAIDARTFGIGNSGNITINASESFTSSNNGRIENSIELDAEGNAGDITINTARFIATSDGGGIDSSTNGRGNGGNISVNASELISIRSRRSISSRVGEDAEGDGGNINISTTRLELSDGGGISGDNNGQGNGSNIFIDASESISIVGTQRDVNRTFTGISSIVNGTGQGGAINLSTSNLIVSDSGVINTTTFGSGDAGDIIIDASESIVINGRRANFSSGIFSRVSSDAEGSGGNVNLSTSSLNITNGGQISAETRGSGNAGNINTNTSNLINLIGLDSGIFSRTGGTGNAGTLDLNTSELQVKENAQIGVNNFIETELQITSEGIIRVFDPVEGSGNSGILKIASDTIQLESRGSITAISAGGDGGNIRLNSNILTLRTGGNISTSAGLQNTSGSGGDISIDSQFIIAFPQGNNDITANAFSGTGGNISIATEGIFGIQERTSNEATNDINASSEATGLDGTIDINNPTVDPTTGLINLPASVGDASEQISQNPCQQGVGSQFIVTGKGGLPPNPTESLNSDGIKVGLVEPLSRQEDEETGRRGEEAVQTNQVQSENSISEAVPAMGWVLNDRGEVTLTAYQTTNSEIERSSQKVSNSCSPLRSH